MKWWPRSNSTATPARPTKPRPWLFYTLLGVGFYLLFLVNSLPASWVAWAVTKYSGKSVVLTQAQGSLWRGQGEILLNLPPSPPQSIGRTQWSVNPLWLLTGKVGIQLTFDDSLLQGQLHLRAGLQSIAIHQGQLTAPAVIVGNIYTPAKLFSPQGTIQIKTDAMEYSPQGLEGLTTIVWQQAASGLSPVQPLGDYRISLQGKGANAAIKLETIDGKLQLAGTGNWDLFNNGLLRFSGNASARQQQEELKPLLQLLGREQGGRRIISFNTRLLLHKKRP